MGHNVMLCIINSINELHVVVIMSYYYNNILTSSSLIHFNFIRKQYTKHG